MTTALLPEKVQELLKQAGMSESELARRIDIPRATLNRLVAGKMSSPKLHVLRAIASYFDISVDQLMQHSQQTSTAASTTLPMIPWNQVHQLDQFKAFPHQHWDGFIPPKDSFLTYVQETRLHYFPNHKQLLLIAPHSKPRPGQLVVLHLNESKENVIRQMFLANQQFRFKHPNTQLHECLTPGSYGLIGVVHQVLQLD